MLKIRLKRLGKKKKPCYRIIAIDSRKKRDGKALKEIGFYDPLKKNTKLDIKKIEELINQGAQLTRTVENILKKTYN